MKQIFLTYTILMLLASPAWSQTDEKKAVELIATQGCRGCHVISGIGGNLGPNLDKVGTRMKRFSIQQKLLDPKHDNPQSVMPDMKHLTPDELRILADFLVDLSRKK